MALEHEQSVQQQLVAQFPFLDGAVTVKRARRVFTVVPQDRFRDVFDFAADRLGFPILCTITGLDEGENLSYIYHLAQENGTILDLKTSVSAAAPVIRTVSDRFPTADIYERELVDLLGTKVEGLKPGRRYPLPDTWPLDQHPLRKDWKPTADTPPLADPSAGGACQI